MDDLRFFKQLNMFFLVQFPSIKTTAHIYQDVGGKWDPSVLSHLLVPGVRVAGELDVPNLGLHPERGERVKQDVPLHQLGVGSSTPTVTPSNVAQSGRGRDEEKGSGSDRRRGRGGVPRRRGGHPDDSDDSSSDDHSDASGAGGRSSDECSCTSGDRNSLTELLKQTNAEERANQHALNDIMVQR